MNNIKPIESFIIGGHGVLETYACDERDVRLLEQDYGKAINTLIEIEIEFKRLRESAETIRDQLYLDGVLSVVVSKIKQNLGLTYEQLKAEEEPNEQAKTEESPEKT